MTEVTRQRRALLIGCGTFTDSSLAQLRSPRRDVEDMSRMLYEAGYAQVFADVDCTTRAAQRAVEAFLLEARVDDALNLIYFSTHGLQDRQGKLYFAFTDTEKRYLSATAVGAEWVRDRVYDSRSKSTLILVDCCFSGSFITGMQARSSGEPDVDVLVRGLPQGSGVAVLTASGEHEASFEDVESPTARTSYFTEAVVAGVATGAADLNRDGRITVDELYEYVYHHVMNGPSPQRPRKLGMGEGTMVVAEPLGQPVPIPAQVSPPTGRAAAPVLRARGVLGYAAFDGQSVVIGKAGFGPVMRGERRLHVSDVAGVSFKPATSLHYGYLQVIQKGVQPAPISRFGPGAGRPPMEDGASVSFARSANAEMQQMRDAIETAIGIPPRALRASTAKNSAWAAIGRGLLWALGILAGLLEAIVIAATVTDNWDDHGVGTAVTANLLSGGAVLASGRVLYINRRK
ncbi:caspase family protein [Micromonospora sp. DH14]|uniref:caspase, EACC1-associated type n=1 Tax=Micromonospora sp. DH14 TaxID=3040120 RepID=UPI0024410805|nr:caspase family protein [Micromonospora sp. DH14]MDG9674702.1 caspase family protein [Micromonospora sp. DH14]